MIFRMLSSAFGVFEADELRQFQRGAELLLNALPCLPSVMG